MDGACFICKIKVEPVDEQVSPVDAPLHCQECDVPAHLSCLPVGKCSHLKGDTLFTVTCPDCSDDKKVQLERMRVSWLQVIHLALYNLSIKESGRQGFFRWRDDICNFIEKHWTILLMDKVKTNNWTSTIAGTLSVNCPKLFKSGQHDFKEPGWWALQIIKPPPRNYDESILKRPKAKPVPSEPSPPVFDDVGLGRGRRKRKVISYRPESYRAAKVAPVEDTKKELSVKESKAEKKANVYHVESREPETLKLTIKREEVSEDVEPSPLASLYTKLDSDLIRNMAGDDPVDDSFSGDFLSFDDSCALIDTEEFSRALNSEKIPEYDSETNSLADDAQSISTGYSTNLTFPKLNDYGTQEVKKRIPMSRLKMGELQNIDSATLVRMTPKQENEFLKRIEQFPDVLASDASTRRLRRQLIVRKRKRELGIPLFDLDKTVFDALKRSAPPEVEKRLFRTLRQTAEDDAMLQRRVPLNKTYHHPALEGVNVLDRFRVCEVPKVGQTDDGHYYRSFQSRLVGRGHELYTRSIVSPYTGRVLKPYIRRDFDCHPPKVRILREILNVTHSSDPHWISPSRSSVDYCYVQPHHIPAINGMCKEFFWPGIDMTECLQYPDFSCVALYKKIVIGFAFLVPDVKYNEAYISFILVHPDWRRVGIATFFIYHLIQTCMGKDITLHVSSSNSSMLLYQKFGFKIEELVLNFYEKYLPEDSTDCRHAFFLRLQR